MLQETIVALLLGDASLTALVDNRVHWGRQPETQRVHPYVTLTLVSEPQGYTLDGPDGVAAALVQVDCWSETYGSALAVSRAVRARLDGTRGTVSGVEIHGIFREGDRDLTGQLGDRTIYGLSADYRVAWSAA